MADFELNLQPGLCKSGPIMYYAQFYLHHADASPELSRQVYIGGSRARPHHLLQKALHEVKREIPQASIGAISIKGLCQRRTHAEKPRLERVIDYVNAPADLRRLAVTDESHIPAVHGFGTVQLHNDAHTTLSPTAFFAVTEQERVKNPVTEVGVIGNSQSFMYVALRGLEEFIQLR